MNNDCAKHQINYNSVQLDKLATAAERFAKIGEDTTAAVYAQMAAKFARAHHSGIWASSAIEQLLTNIGERIGPAFPSNVSSNPGTILHVLTTGYSIGGHTRSVWRWIREDSGRSHSVALTNQASTAVPYHLVNAVSESGGKLHFLDSSGGGLIERAVALRDLAASFDRVVLHIHPHDVVPNIAFCRPDARPPLIYVNHADHTFWLGVGISDLVLHLRQSGLPISTRFRGIQNSRCPLLPVPLSRIERTVAREEAKRQLGIPADASVLFSVASPYKYEPILGETSFVDALLPVLKNEKNAILVVVGPSARGQWERGSQECEDRIRAYGTRTDVGVFYQAADIYLDPFPFASTTSFLEAGIHGSPLVSYSRFSDETSVLGADSPELDHIMLRLTSLESYQARLADLIRDKAGREQLGEQTRNAIIDAHVGKKWQDQLENIYALAGAIPRASSSFTAAPADVRQVDIRLVCIASQSNNSPSITEMLREDVGLLPLAQRLRSWASQPSRHLRLLWRFMFTEWFRQKAVRRAPWKRPKINREAVVA